MWGLLLPAYLTAHVPSELHSDPLLSRPQPDTLDFAIEFGPFVVDFSKEKDIQPSLINSRGNRKNLQMDSARKSLCAGDVEETGRSQGFGWELCDSLNQMTLMSHRKPEGIP